MPFSLIQIQCNISIIDQGFNHILLLFYGLFYFFCFVFALIIRAFVYRLHLRFSYILVQLNNRQSITDESLIRQNDHGI